jgi:hypothetical protein
LSTLDERVVSTNKLVVVMVHGQYILFRVQVVIDFTQQFKFGIGYTVILSTKETIQFSPEI